MAPYSMLKTGHLVSRPHPTRLSYLPSLFVTQWGTIKMIPLSPPCSPLRELLNIIHCHLICDQVFNGSGKLEGTVLCLHGRSCSIQANCWLSNCISLKRGFKSVQWGFFPPPNETMHCLNWQQECSTSCSGQFTFSVTPFSSSIFVGTTKCMAAVPPN